VLDGCVVDVVGGTAPGFVLAGLPGVGLELGLEFGLGSELGLGLPFPLYESLLLLGGLAGAGGFDVMGFGGVTDDGAGVLLEGLEPEFEEGGSVGKGVDIELLGVESSPEGGVVFGGWRGNYRQASSLNC